MWLEAVDGYCERLGPGLWAEPLNAVTNAAFLVAAALMWGRVRGLPLARAMCVVLAAIAVGSGLFHTFANRLTGALDVTPILGFILIYIFAASRDMLGLKGWQAGLAVLAFFPFAIVGAWGAARLMPTLGGSAAYVPVPILIAVYAALMARRAPATARGLAIGAAILMVSLTARTLDAPACAALPMGTHFLWHLLNALMLGWMIEVYRRHMLGARQMLAAHGGRG